MRFVRQAKRPGVNPGRPTSCAGFTQPCLTHRISCTCPTLLIKFSVHLELEKLPMIIKVIGVVGAGTMGNGIAHVCAQSGFKVVLVEVERAGSRPGHHPKNLAREVEKSKLIGPPMRDAALARIQPTLNQQGSRCVPAIVRPPARDSRSSSSSSSNSDESAPGDDPRHQYFVHLHHQTRGQPSVPGSRHRHALSSIPCEMQ